MGDRATEVGLGRQARPCDLDVRVLPIVGFNAWRLTPERALMSLVMSSERQASAGPAASLLSQELAYEPHKIGAVGFGLFMHPRSKHRSARRDLAESLTHADSMVLRRQSDNHLAVLVR
jgi:hypothetical protein